MRLWYLTTVLNKIHKKAVHIHMQHSIHFKNYIKLLNKL